MLVTKNKITLRLFKGDANNKFINWTWKGNIFMLREVQEQYSRDDIHSNFNISFFIKDE